MASRRGAEQQQASSLGKERLQLEDPSVPQHAASQRLASLGRSFSLARTFAYYKKAVLQLGVRDPAISAL